ncbi:MAG: ABC transporter permease [Acidimicrobiales bacterium]|nr:ABC transporter permease [Acidimicrobiales bacterium]
MTGFVLRRLLSLLGVLLVLSLAVFVIQTVLPADPVRASLGANASPALVEQKREELGYNDPLTAQYVRFLGNVVQGDLSTSLRTKRPVTDDLSRFAKPTFELAGMAALLAMGLGLVLGVSSARGGRGAGAVRLVMLGAASAPTFFVAIVGILLFYRKLGWLPASGRLDRMRISTGPTGLYTVDSLLHGNWQWFSSAVRHLVLPAFCLAVGPAVAIGRVLRGALLDVMRLDHVRTARSKGLRERRVILRHGLRNAMQPTLSMAGLQVGLLLTGVVVVELVFAWPGLGLYTTQAIQQADFPAVIGIVLVMGAAYVVINALVDIGQVIADPRLRAKKA